MAVNTSGATAASTNKFEVTQTNTAANMVAIYAITQGTGSGSSAIYSNHTGAMGAGNTAYALYATKTGASAGVNIAGLFTASGGASNYAIVVPSGGGNVGIGTSAPASLLHVAGTMQLGTASATTGQLRFYNSSSSFYTAIESGNATVSRTYVLPTADGTSGMVLSSTTTGTMSWVAGSSSGWAITGNSGTTAGTNFVGTTDVRDFVVKTNSTERMRVLSTGNVGVGMNAPAAPLHVAGQIRTGIPAGGLGGASATTGSLLFYNSLTSNITGIQSGVASSSVTYTLPVADGSVTDLLQTEGGGVLSWIKNSGSAGPAGPPGPSTAIANTNYVSTCASSTYTFAPGAGTVVLAELWGGGGGGGGGSPGSSTAVSGGGGGGGCYGKIIFTAVAGTYTAYIGAAGTGGAASSDGTDGGNSYIVSPSTTTVICVGGGSRGTSQATSNVGADGGDGGVAITSGFFSCDGGEGGVGSITSGGGGVGGSKGGSSGTDAGYGGGGGAGGGADGGCGGRGGGGGTATTTVGNPGCTPGGGGGGGSGHSAVPLAGGSGGCGMVVVAY